MTDFSTVAARRELARSIDRWARDVGGVQTLYAADSRWAQVRNVARALTGRGPNDPLSAVSSGPDGLVVHIRAGVNTSAGKTAGAIHDAVLDHLLRAGSDVARIEVTVVDCTRTGP